MGVDVGKLLDETKHWVTHDWEALEFGNQGEETRVSNPVVVELETLARATHVNREGDE